MQELEAYLWLLFYTLCLWSGIAFAIFLITLKEYIL